MKTYDKRFTWDQVNLIKRLKIDFFCHRDTFFLRNNNLPIPELVPIYDMLIISDCVSRRDTSGYVSIVGDDLHILMMLFNENLINQDEYAIKEISRQIMRRWLYDLKPLIDNLQRFMRLL